MPRFALVRDANLVTVTLVDPRSKKDRVARFIKDQLKSHGGELTMNELSNLVYENIPDFKLKDLGYAQFSKLVAGVPGVQVKTISATEKRAILRTGGGAER
jgi:hypothetical protein